MLLISLVLITVVGLTGLLNSDYKENAMNQYCYNECAEGKHYKEKVNVYNIF